jgi:hypothetical protein
MLEDPSRLSFRGATGEEQFLKMVVPKAPWSAVVSATALLPGFQGGSFAAALQGASRIVMHGGEPKGHEVFARNDPSGDGFTNVLQERA